MYKDGEEVTYFRCLFCGTILALSEKQDDYQCYCGEWAKGLLWLSKLYYTDESKTYSQNLAQLYD